VVVITYAQVNAITLYEDEAYVSKEEFKTFMTTIEREMKILRENNANLQNMVYTLFDKCKLDTAADDIIREGFDRCFEYRHDNTPHIPGWK